MANLCSPRTTAHAGCGNIFISSLALFLAFFVAFACILVVLKHLLSIHHCHAATGGAKTRHTTMRARGGGGGGTIRPVAATNTPSNHFTITRPRFSSETHALTTIERAFTAETTPKKKTWQNGIDRWARNSVTKD